MSYASWTDDDWRKLISLCRADGAGLKEEDIRKAAFSYMHVGSDAGENSYGLAGTVVALNVDKVQSERLA